MLTEKLIQFYIWSSFHSFLLPLSVDFENTIQPSPSDFIVNLLEVKNLDIWSLKSSGFIH